MARRGQGYIRRIIKVIGSRGMTCAAIVQEYNERYSHGTTHQSLAQKMRRNKQFEIIGETTRPRYERPHLQHVGGYKIWAVCDEYLEGLI